MNDKPTEPTPVKPALLCRLIGHKWVYTELDEKTHPGFRLTTFTEAKACRRCGIPNPNFIQRRQ